METKKSTLKKFFVWDKYYPYTYSIIFLILALIYYYFIERKLDLFKFWWERLITFSTTIITVISIFIGFIGVWITLVFQDKENANIKMIKANNKYDLLLNYFKKPITFWLTLIVFSMLISMWLSLSPYFIIVYISFFVLLLLLNYRIIYFLFKILRDK